jgi:hypothetical protein
MREMQSSLIQRSGTMACGESVQPIFLAIHVSNVVRTDARSQLQSGRCEYGDLNDCNGLRKFAAVKHPLRDMLRS